MPQRQRDVEEQRDSRDLDQPRLLGQAPP